MIVSNGFVFKDQVGDTIFSISNFDDGTTEIVTYAGGESESFYIPAQDIAELAQALFHLLPPNFAFGRAQPQVQG